MGKVLIPGGGGGGAISDDITLRQSDVPVGLTAVTSDSDDEIVEGTLTTTVTPDKVLKDETFYNTETHQEESGTIESMEAQTITPGASAQIVSCTGKYMTGDVTINAVAGLSAGNIANGVTVGGVAGTYKGLGNATQAQVLSGRTFSTASLSNASGTMTNYSGYTSTSNYVSSTFRSGTTGYVFASPGGTGYYTTGSYLRIPATNLSAANIKKGVTILGITGTWQGYVDSPLYLYKQSGNTWTNMTNKGLTVTGESKGSSTTTSFYTSTAYGIKWGISGVSGSSHYIIGRTVGTVNLTNYNKLILTNCGWGGDKTYYNSSTGNCAYVGVSTNASLTSASFSASVKIDPAGDSDFYGDRTITISSLSGSYYIYFYAKPVARSSGDTDCYMTADDIYLTT